MRRIATICARGGSKGIPDKNLQELGGRPLLAHAIEQARESGIFAAIAVSSDATAILDAGRMWGSSHQVRRPAAMAGDTAAKLPAIRHGVERVETEIDGRFDIIVDLAVTSPLRTAEDICAAVALLEASDTPLVLSAHESKDSPYFNIVEISANRLSLSKPPPTTVVRRQDAPRCYALNGAVYVWRRGTLFNSDNRVVQPEARLYIMPDSRALDIDTPHDLAFARFLTEAQQHYPSGPFR